MATEALLPFKHTSIGTKTDKARTATAHVSYIMRSQAMTKFQSENMPDGGRGTRVFFDKLWEKAGHPENYRICDKFMITLPLELTREQRHEAVASFMHALGHGRIAWCAAHHDEGEDAHNPHAHVAFKDADITTGKKVIGTTTNAKDVRDAKAHGWKVPPRMTTWQLRCAWCDHLNGVMETLGLERRFDPRTYDARGIDKDAGIHIGPKAQALAEKGYEFESRDLERTGPDGKQTIRYSEIDHGSRAEHNERIAAANKAREQSPAPFSREHTEKRELRDAQRDARKALYEQQRLDRAALRDAHQTERRRHDSWAKTLYAGARQKAFDAVKEKMEPRWEAMRALKTTKERAAAAKSLKEEQKKLYATASAAETGKLRPEKNAAYHAMLGAQEQERIDLRAAHRTEFSALARQHIAEQAALHEKWRAVSLERSANRLDAKLSAHQGMAAQQAQAVKAIKLHNRARQANSGNAPENAPQNPREASRLYIEDARKEEQKRAFLRGELDSAREKNHTRADPHRFKEAGREQTRKDAGKESPRAIMAPGLAAAARSSKRNGRQPGPLTDTPNSTASGGRPPQDRAQTSPERSQRAAGGPQGNANKDRGQNRPGAGRDR